jgi:hypothetical protein
VAVRDLHSLVRKAVDSRSPPGERHEAFGELVAGFQDMAFACAYGVLSDFCLAEDAAQEGFHHRLTEARPTPRPGSISRMAQANCAYAVQPPDARQAFEDRAAGVGS